ncbi:MAG: hypothetical protein EBS31_00080 [Burkholderiaceae bacterium]|nr:hypothetical protein [Burkholderiaceae bacterium]
MITNTGKGILAKYLLGQAPAYASYIAVGCGPAALNSEDPGFTDLQKEAFLEKTSLDFEMFRVPIISKGFVNEDDLVKIVLTAELPTEERYEITEVGIFSAGSNPSAVAADSRMLYSFSQTEGWEYHTSSGVSEIQTILSPLDSDNTDSIISVTNPVFFTNADNRTFIQNQTRVLRNERCRFLNNMIVVSGNSSTLAKNQSGVLVPGSGASHIHLTDASINLNRHAPSDEIRVAFSVINKKGEVNEHPDNVKILIEFAPSDSPQQGEYAALSIDVDSSTFNGTGDFEVDFTKNRYVVSTKQLQDLFYTSGFSWESVSVVRVYASVFKNNAPSSDFYVCLDAMRIENTSVNNPLYGLTGYSVIKNNDALPIVKLPNTSNFIEFRLALGVQ